MWTLRARLMCILCSLLACVGSQGIRAQVVEQDTNYVRDLSKRVTLRFYASHKFNSMLLRAEEPYADLRYRPNGQVNLGLGASLRKFTLNIGVRMPFVNDDVATKGRTRYLDAQANVYGTRQASNLFLQIYKGYHITSHTKELLGWADAADFPYRGDLLQYNVGISSLRVVNDRRFSYRAAFNQDAVQLRSQGSWLIGGYVAAYFLRADSALVPTRIQGRFTEMGAIRSGSYYDVGPMAGYAYTRVFGAHWFITLSGAVGTGLSLQITRFDKRVREGGSRHGGLGWHTQLRAAAGYNSRTRYFGVVFSQEHVGYLQGEQQRFIWDVGLVRLVFAQRFRERPKVMERSTRWLERKKGEVLP